MGEKELAEWGVNSARARYVSQDIQCLNNMSAKFIAAVVSLIMLPIPPLLLLRILYVQGAGEEEGRRAGIGAKAPHRRPHQSLGDGLRGRQEGTQEGEGREE